jgi:hypothetical protein
VVWWGDTAGKARSWTEGRRGETLEGRSASSAKKAEKGRKRQWLAVAVP